MNTATVVGIDLVHVPQVARAVELFATRYLERVYTPAELSYCLQNEQTTASRLAARFAAKEATIKVLGPERRPSWKAIEVVRMPSGACHLVLHEEARELALGQGFCGFSLSMTHEEEYASAVVLGERRQRRDHFVLRIKRRTKSKKSGRKQS